jgi:hypothetical protein
MVLRALLPLIDHKEDRSFLEKAQERMKHWNSVLVEQGTRDSLPMNHRSPF